MYELGTTVYVVERKEFGRGLEVVAATVFCIDGNVVVLHRPSRTPNTTIVLRVPIDELSGRVFSTADQAEAKKLRMDDGNVGSSLGRPLKGRTRRVPLTVHAPLDTLEIIDEYVKDQGGAYSRSDFYEEAAKRYLQQLGVMDDEGDRTTIVPINS